MRIKQKKYIAPTVVLAVAGLAAGSAYLLKVPPFEQIGTIAASDLCEGLGTSSKRVSALKEVLPHQSKYSFSEGHSNKRIDQSDNNYISRCSVNGEERMLLHTKAQMMHDEPVQSWLSSTVIDETGDQKLFESFEAGNGGVVSPSKAAILVPCASAGNIPGGEYSVSVVVSLNQRTEFSEEAVKEGLVDLALSAAQYVHKDAKCDLPSKLPDSS